MNQNELWLPIVSVDPCEKVDFSAVSFGKSGEDLLPQGFHGLEIEARGDLWKKELQKLLQAPLENGFEELVVSHPQPSEE